ncbi:MAG: hypothetical protein ABTQ32_28320 [Myxococcaceae bacterium]
MITPRTLVAHQVVNSTRSEDDVMMGGVAIGAFVLGVAAIAFGVRFARQKKQALALLLFLGAGLAWLSCAGISALLVLAKLAWH